MGRFLIILSVISSLAFSSCETSEGYKLASSGLPGEVIVIMDHGLWHGMLGDTVRHYLESYQPGLPQAEYLFNVGQYNSDNFSKIVKGHRNIIQFDLSSKIKTPKIEFLKDVWSTNQLVIKLSCKDQLEATTLFDKESQTIINLLNTRERERLIEHNIALQTSAAITDSLLKKHEIKLVLPKDCELAEDYGNFVWITRERIRYVSGEAHDVDQGIFIYHYPYVSDSTFTLEFLIAKRDSLLRKYVPGPSEGSYMATELDSMYYPFAKNVSLNGKFAMEVRGLYKTVNDYYGGPFISLTAYDEVRKRIVTIDCFVFAPKFNKREYMREMEAVCYSLGFPPAK